METDTRNDKNQRAVVLCEGGLITILTSEEIRMPSVKAIFGPGKGFKYVTLEEPIKRDPLLFPESEEGDQITYPDTIEIDKNLNVSGESDVYDIYRTSKDGVIRGLPYYIEDDSDKISKFIFDTPTHADYLGHSNLSRVLEALIEKEDNKESLKIGIIGPWGSGKTSLALNLKSRLAKNREIKTINFNAWMHESSESISAALTQAIVDGLSQPKTNNKINDLIDSKITWLKYIFKYKISLGRVLLWMLALLVICEAIIFNEDLIKKITDYGLPNITETSIWILLGYAIWKLANYRQHPVMIDIQKNLKVPGFDDEVGNFQKMKLAVEQISELTINHNERVFLTIDDLDRCREDTISEILDATKLVLENRKFIVVMPFDHNPIYSSINNNINNKSTDSEKRSPREHILKLLDVCISLPTPSPGQVWSYIIKSQFIKEHTENFAETKEKAINESIDKDHIAKLIEYANRFNINNPRQIKRLILSYKLSKMLFDTDSNKVEIHANHRTEEIYPLMFTVAYLESTFSGNKKSDEDTHSVITEIQKQTKNNSILNMAKTFIAPP